MEEKFNKVIEEFKKQTEKECYRVELVDGVPTILDDKLGGQPYLPVGEEMPKDEDGNYMPLLLQINLKNIDLKGYPNEGILQIYTDKDVNYPCEYAVRYYKEGLEYQNELPEVDVSNYIVNKSIKIRTEKDICHMTPSDYRFVNVMCNIVNDLYNANVTNSRQLDNFFGDFDWYGKTRDVIKIHSSNIGGYPEFTQTDPRYSKIKDKDECLFKLDSYLNTSEINIGDSGILFALISQEDIEKNNFENAVVDWDCY